MAVNINVPSQVKTYANLAAFPATGALKTIYIAEDTNKTYRWTGSVYVEVSASAASGITIGTTAITSGTVGRVLFQGTGNVVQQSSSLFWDATNERLGIGTSSPVSPLHIKGVDNNTITIDNAGTRYTTATLSNNGTGKAQWTFDNNTNLVYFGPYSTNGGLVLRSNGTDRMTIFGSTGNIGINTTTDSGFKLDVNGTARVQGNTQIGSRLTIGTSGTSFGTYIETTGGGGFMNIVNGTSGGFTMTFTNSNAERMRIASTGNILINTTTDAGFRLDVNGTARVATNLTVSTAGNGNMNTFLGGSVAIGSDWVNDGYILKIKANNTGVAGIYSRAGGASGYPILFCQDANGTTSTTFIVRENGNVIIGATTNIASSKLTIESTTQGFLPPRMTTTQKNAIASPAAGLVVYDTTLNKLCVYTTAWETVTSL